MKMLSKLTVWMCACAMACGAMGEEIIRVGDGGGNPDFVEGTWPAGSIVEVLGNIAIGRGTRLTIEEGVVVRFAAQTSLLVQNTGELIVAGSVDQPVRLTSFKDYTGQGGDDSLAGLGDWGGLEIKGTADIRYANIYYGNGDETGVIFVQSGGTVSIKNSVIAHAWGAAFCNIGQLTVENCAMYDMKWGVYLHSAGSNGESMARFAHCVVDNVTIGVYQDGGDGEFSNCSISDYRLYGATYLGGDVQFVRCNFYSEQAGSLLTASPMEATRILEENPKYLDAASGDFRLAETSALIDAGDPDEECRLDYWGNPRVSVPGLEPTGTAEISGAYSDIGLHEWQLDFTNDDVDLVVDEVNIPSATLHPGDELVVTWIVKNIGAIDFEGTRTDRLTFVPIYGEEVFLADVEQTQTLGAGETATCSAAVTIPCVAEREWYVRVDANEGNRIFEKKGGDANNSQTSLNQIAILVEATGLPATIELAPGSSKVYQLTGISGAGQRLKVSGAGTWTAAGAYGGIPTSRYAWSSIRDDENDLWFSIPVSTEGRIPYLLLENKGTEVAVLTVTGYESAMMVFRTDRHQLRTSPTVSVTVDGLGLASAVSGKMKCLASDEVLEVALGGYLDTLRYAIFNLNGAEEGEYLFGVTDENGETAWVPEPIEVLEAETGALLSHFVGSPEHIRPGAVHQGWVDYANQGDADMEVPVFLVHVPNKDGTTEVSERAEGPFSPDNIYVVGASPTLPIHVLKAGESGRAYFYVRSEGDSEFGVWNAAGTRYPVSEGYLETWLEQQEAMAERDEEQEAVAFDNLNQEIMQPDPIILATIRGVLTDAETGDPLANIPLWIYQENSDLVYMPVESDEDGCFTFEEIATNGIFHITSDKVTFADDVSITLVDQTECPIVQIQATALCRIQGSVMAGEAPWTGEIRIIHGGVYADVPCDEEGFYQADDLQEGTYSIYIAGGGGYASCYRTNIVLDATLRTATEDFVLEEGQEIHGVALNAETGDPVAGATLQIFDMTNGLPPATTPTTEDGEFVFAGLLPGKHLIVSADNDWIVAQEYVVDVIAGGSPDQEISLLPAAPFYIWPPVGYAPLEVSATVQDDSRLPSVISAWAWDFDGDGEIDSTEETPLFTYEEPGRYQVTLTITDNQGAQYTYAANDAVRVKEYHEPVMNPNLIALGKDDSEYAWETITTNLMVLTQCVAEVTQQITSNSVFMLYSREEDDAYFCHATSVEEQNGKWLVGFETVQDIGEIFESVSVEVLGKGIHDPGPQSRAAGHGDRNSVISIPFGQNSSVGFTGFFRPSYVFNYEKLGDEYELDFYLEPSLGFGLNFNIDEEWVYCTPEPKEVSASIPLYSMGSPGLVGLKFEVDLDIAAQASINVKSKINASFSPGFEVSGKFGIHREPTTGSSISIVKELSPGRRGLETLNWNQTGSLDFDGNVTISLRGALSVVSGFTVPIINKGVEVEHISLVKVEAGIQAGVHIKSDVKVDRSQNGLSTDGSLSFEPYVSYGIDWEFLSVEESWWWKIYQWVMDVDTKKLGFLNIPMDINPNNWSFHMPSFGDLEFPDGIIKNFKFSGCDIFGSWPSFSLPSLGSMNGMNWEGFDFSKVALPVFPGFGGLGTLNLKGENWDFDFSSLTFPSIKAEFPDFSWPKMKWPNLPLGFHLPSLGGVDVSWLKCSLPQLAEMGELPSLGDFHFPDFSLYDDIDWSKLPVIGFPDMPALGYAFKFGLPNLPMPEIPQGYIPVNWLNLVQASLDWGDGQAASKSGTLQPQDLVNWLKNDIPTHMYEKPGIYILTLGLEYTKFKPFANALKKPPSVKFALCVLSDDVDGDGMPNLWESIYDFDPFNPADGGGDADGDGIPNFVEFLGGTNPRNRDTDGDGMPDGYEYKYLDGAQRGLDPHKDDACKGGPYGGDADGDGLKNYIEYAWGSNPCESDTDGGGKDDKYEWKNRMNPTSSDDDKKDDQGEENPGDDPTEKDVCETDDDNDSSEEGDSKGREIPNCQEVRDNGGQFPPDNGEDIEVLGRRTTAGGKGRREDETGGDDPDRECCVGICEGGGDGGADGPGSGTGGDSGNGDGDGGGDNGGNTKKCKNWQQAHFHYCAVCVNGIVQTVLSHLTFSFATDCPQGQSGTLNGVIASLVGVGTGSSGSIGAGLSGLSGWGGGTRCGDDPKVPGPDPGPNGPNPPTPANDPGGSSGKSAVYLITGDYIDASLDLPLRMGGTTAGLKRYLRNNEWSFWEAASMLVLAPDDGTESEIAVGTGTLGVAWNEGVAPGAVSGLTNEATGVSLKSVPTALWGPWAGTTQALIRVEYGLIGSSGTVITNYGELVKAWRTAVEGHNASAAEALEAVAVSGVVRVTAAEDAEGRRTSYEWNGSGVMTVAHFADGTQESYEYGSGDLMSGKTKRDGEHVGLTHDNYGYLTALNDTKYEYTYDSGTKTYYAAIRYPDGRVGERWFDDEGGIIRHSMNGAVVYDEAAVKADALQTTKPAWPKEVLNDAELPVTVEYRSGATEAFAWDGPGYQRSGVSEATGETQAWTYDEAGREIASTRAGLSHNFERNRAGYVVLDRVDSASGTEEIEWGWDAAGNATEGRMNSWTRTNVYDLAGRVLSARAADGGSWTFVRDAEGRVTSWTQPDGTSGAKAYDGRGRMTWRRSPSGVETWWHHATNGLLTGWSNSLGRRVSYQYDKGERVAKATDEDGDVRTYEYDSAGNWRGLAPELRTFVNDGEGGLSLSVTNGGRVTTARRLWGTWFLRDVQANDQTWRLERNDEGQVTALVRAPMAGAPTTNSWAYDAAGRLAGWTDATGVSWSRGYDAAGFIAWETNGAGAGRSWTHDGTGRLTAVSDGAGRTSTFVYDPATGRTTTDLSDGSRLVSQSDAWGREIARTDAAGTLVATERRFDGAMLRRTWTAAGAELADLEATWSWDGDGQLLAQGMTGGPSTRFERTGSNRCERTVTSFGAFEAGAAVERDANGRVIAVTGADGERAECVWGDDGEVSGWMLPEGSVWFARDLTERTRTTLLPSGHLVTERTDLAGLVTNVSLSDADGMEAWSLALVRDAAGRIVSQGASTLAWDGAGRLVSVDGTSYARDAAGNRSGSGWTTEGMDRLAAWPGGTYGYDTNGAVVTRTCGAEELSFVRDLAGRVSEVRDATDGLVARFIYDADGRRLGKETADGDQKWYLWNGGRLAAELSGTGVVERVFGYWSEASRSPDWVRANGVLLVVLKDGFGVPTALVSALNGAVTEVNTGTTFGEGWACPMAPVWADGLLADAETGLMGGPDGRLYDPTTGRWLSPTPGTLEAGLNRYAREPAAVGTVREFPGLSMPGADPEYDVLYAFARRCGADAETAATLARAELLLSLEARSDAAARSWVRQRDAATADAALRLVGEVPAGQFLCTRKGIESFLKSRRDVLEVTTELDAYGKLRSSMDLEEAFRLELAWSAGAEDRVSMGAWRGTWGWAGLHPEGCPATERWKALLLGAAHGERLSEENLEYLGEAKLFALSDWERSATPLDEEKAREKVDEALTELRRVLKSWANDECE